MGIIAYPLNNTTYSAEDAMLSNLPVSSGVYATINNLSLSLAGGLSATISAGLAFIRYSTAKGFTVYSNSAETITFDSADPALPRIDRVVLQWKESANSVSFVIKKGTPSSSPVAVARSTASNLYELVLFDVRIPAGATALNAANVTDQRLNESLCGLMGLHNLKIDTAVFDAQIKAVINEANTLINNSVNSALQAAKNSGDFKGDPGYTPQRGKDYWTAADQTAIVNSVLSNFTDVSEVAM